MRRYVIYAPAVDEQTAGGALSIPAQAVCCVKGQANARRLQEYPPRAGYKLMIFDKAEEAARMLISARETWDRRLGLYVYDHGRISPAEDAALITALYGDGREKRA